MLLSPAGCDCRHIHGFRLPFKMHAMKRGNSRRLIGFAAIFLLALAAVAFYTVRDFLAAFVLFSFVFVALGAAIVLVISAEEALVWIARRIEGYFGRLRSRHLALAAHAGAHQSGLGNHS